MCSGSRDGRVIVEGTSNDRNAFRVKCGRGNLLVSLESSANKTIRCYLRRDEVRFPRHHWHFTSFNSRLVRLPRCVICIPLAICICNRFNHPVIHAYLEVSILHDNSTITAPNETCALVIALWIRRPHPPATHFPEAYCENN